MRVLIAPDKFKGTLTAQEAASAMARGWAAARPTDILECLPISDGGDGFGPVMAGFWKCEEFQTDTVDAAFRPRTTRWWWHSHTRSAVIESAEAIGLALLPPGLLHPFQLDTRGLAKVFLDAAHHGASRALLGIGGSATNDGGFGLARELGWTFLDSDGGPIRDWPDLTRLDQITPPSRDLLNGVAWTVAVDVQNPLLGPAGASRIYGPQKGLREQDMAKAEAALMRLAEVFSCQFHREPSTLPGSGAAGGLGFGLSAFLNAELKPGFAMIAKEAGLEGRVQASDLIITGEGAMDASTAMGKGAGQLAILCRSMGRRCVGIAGFVDPSFLSKSNLSGFESVHAVSPDLASAEESRSSASHWLETLASQVARRVQG